MNLTSAEQSRKLIELGIDENTRDYVVFDSVTGNHQFPAWTAEKLLELMPSEDNFSDENYIDMRLCIGYCMHWLLSYRLYQCLGWYNSY